MLGMRTGSSASAADDVVFSCSQYANCCCNSYVLSHCRRPRWIFVEKVQFTSKYL